VNCVKYSLRGDVLAITSGGSLYLFDPYTMDKIFHVTAHAS